MAEHFLLSAQARTLSLAKVMRLSDAEAYETFAQIRWAQNYGEPFPSMAAAEQALRAEGFLVQVAARPGLGHGIDEPGLQLGAAMLKQSLYPDETRPEAEEPEA